MSSAQWPDSATSKIHYCCPDWCVSDSVAARILCLIIMLHNSLPRLLSNKNKDNQKNWLQVPLDISKSQYNLKSICLWSALKVIWLLLLFITISILEALMVFIYLAYARSVVCYGPENGEYWWNTYLALWNFDE